MKSMVEGDCGQANALVGLANNYGQQNGRLAPSSSRAATALMPQGSLGDQMANEFLASKTRGMHKPHTFDMNALSQQLPRRAHSVASSSLAANWTSEFAQRAPSMGAQWASQFQQQQQPRQFEGAWHAASGHAPVFHQQGPSAAHGDSSMWSAEFLDNVDTSLQNAFSNSSSMASEWAHEFTGAQQEQPDVWKKLEKEWDTIQFDSLEALRKDVDVSNLEGRYEHQIDNPYLSEGDPLRLGDNFVQNGDLSNAMLAYEAAVQKNPEDPEAWCRLGLSHAENEHDVKAIAAFRNCLKLQPDNQEALLALSVSLANESLENDALEQLDKWITVHNGGDPNTVQHRAPAYSSFLDHNTFDRKLMSRSQFEQVEARFLEAAQRQSGTADSALQNSLGVLYNLNRNFDRAVDCMRLAIAARPHDPRLWNRLGATLANGDRTTDAVAAYREALSRYPSYVRARYNLGISCMHLNSYREAVDHFMSALELQKGGSEGSSIWNTMRSAVIRLSGPADDMLQALDNRDVHGLRAAINAVPRN